VATKFLSAVIITKNEEKNIANCLESLIGIADEVLVLDSHSTDRTPEICHSFGARLVPVEWLGYAATKNYGNSLASSDWILSLDADEVISPELSESIIHWKASENNHFCSFSRLTNYCGRWIHHGGWYPDIKVRLFDRRSARWIGEPVHETLQYPESTLIEKLSGDLLHYSFHTISQHVSQVNHYSSLAARGKKGGILKMIFSPLWSFIHMYIIRLGFLDGREGFIIAVISGYARFLKYAKAAFPEG
jgi:glycosyltransferase involved in cell wall biosynthesis